MIEKYFIVKQSLLCYILHKGGCFILSFCEKSHKRDRLPAGYYRIRPDSSGRPVVYGSSFRCFTARNVGPALWFLIRFLFLVLVIALLLEPDVVDLIYRYVKIVLDKFILLM